MQDDMQKSNSENQELIKETESLEVKYEELKQECEEKMDVMK